MEKIIKLLREYKPSEYDYVEHDGGIFNRETDSTGEYNRYFDLEPIIISKKFGFIKWLVENDKIDEREIPIEDFYPERRLEYVLLMLLSIKENPIEYLVSILK